MWGRKRQPVEAARASEPKPHVVHSPLSSTGFTTVAMIAAYDKELAQMQEHGMTVTKLEPGSDEYKSFSDSLASLAKTQEARFPPELVRQVLDAQQ